MRAIPTGRSPRAEHCRPLTGGPPPPRARHARSVTSRRLPHSPDSGPEAPRARGAADLSAYRGRPELRDVAPLAERVLPELDLSREEPEHRPRQSRQEVT